MQNSIARNDQKKKMNKSELRKQIKEKGKIFFQNPHNKPDASFIIGQKICASSEFKNADVIFAFMPMIDEPNIGVIILEAFMSGKKVAVPKILDEKGEMEFYWISSDEKMKEGTFGIYEPEGTNPVDMNTVTDGSLLIVPGVAFTKDGKRLGRGKGFYDRFMAKYKNKFSKMGICFDFQLVDDIPIYENDIKVDKVISA